MTPAPVAGTLTVVVPMFRLARGLRLSSFRREWLVKEQLPKLFGFKVDATAGPAVAGPAART
jgi:hypothetical protein